MIQTTLYKLNRPAYDLFDRARQKVRPWFESDEQKHQRERQQADYLLLSLTNCGRTWLRVILGRAMQLHYDIEEGINLHDLFRFSETVPLIPAIKPMHEKYGQFGNRYEGQKVILLSRDPRDALVSRYHQQSRKPQSNTLSFDSLEDYITAGVDLAAYIQFYNDWQRHRDTAKDFLLVRYEDMKVDTLKEVSRVFDFLQMSVSVDEVQQAIDYASFKNMRKMELEGSQQVRTGVMSARDVGVPESFKVRKGSVGGYRTELSDEAIAYLDSTVQTQLDPVYGYH
ncbi:MAG: sulfotransferase domain-containing protein [Cyanobacteria bacterium J06560_6]